MPQNSPPAVTTGDRRVQRTRAALYEAAVRLVSERGTTAIPVTELADTAQVSRQVVYLQFGDRDALLAAAAMDLCERELYPLLPDLSDGAQRDRLLAVAQHLAEHHRFYRALIGGSCAFTLRTAAVRSFATLHRHSAVPFLDVLPAQEATVAGTFLVGGAMAVIEDWLLAIPDLAPDPLVLTDRLCMMAATFWGLNPK